MRSRASASSTRIGTPPTSSPATATSGSAPAAAPASSPSRERALERITPVLSGFAGTEVDLPLDSVPAPAPSAQAFTVAAPDHLAFARLTSGLRDILDVGVPAIESELAARAGDVMFFADRYEIPVLTPARTAVSGRDRRAGARAAGRRTPRRVAVEPRARRDGPRRHACGCRRTWAPAPTRCACSAMPSPRSPPPASGDLRAARPTTSAAASGVHMFVTAGQRVDGVSVAGRTYVHGIGQGARSSRPYGLRLVTHGRLVTAG